MCCRSWVRFGNVIGVVVMKVVKWLLLLLLLLLLMMTTMLEVDNVYLLHGRQPTAQKLNLTLC